MRVCAIDIGSNSVRCLIADVTDRAIIRPVQRYLRITRISAGMAGKRAISEEAAERTLSAVISFLILARRAKAERFLLFGTQALREAANAASFVHNLKGATGLSVRILSGEEEAAWICKGVTAALGEPLQDALIVDIGGGSTELIYTGTQTGPVPTSLPLGCVCLTERYLVSDPPQPSEMRKVRDFVADTLAKGAPRMAGSTKRLAGAGGTITTAATLAQHLDRYKPDKVHGFRLRFAAVESLVSELAAMPLERRRKLAGLEEERADVIPAGLLILSGVMAFCGAEEITVSDQGILYGAVLSAVSPDNVPRQPSGQP